MTSHKEQPAVDTSAEKIARQIEKLEKRAAACRQTHNDFMAAEFEEYADSLRSLAAHPAEPEGMELETTADIRASFQRWAEKHIAAFPSEMASAPPVTALMLLRDFDRLSTQLRDAQARGKGVEEALDRAAKRVRNQRDRVRDIAGTMELGLTRTQLEGVSGELDHLGMDCARAALSRPEGSAST